MSVEVEKKIEWESHSFGICSQLDLKGDWLTACDPENIALKMLLSELLLTFKSILLLLEFEIKVSSP